MVINIILYKTLNRFYENITPLQCTIIYIHIGGTTNSKKDLNGIS